MTMTDGLKYVMIRAAACKSLYHDSVTRVEHFYLGLEHY